MTADTFLYITNSENAPVVTEHFYNKFSGIACRSVAKLIVETPHRDKFFSIENIRNPFHSNTNCEFSSVIKPLQMALSMPHTYFILDRMRNFKGGKVFDVYRNVFNYIPVLQQGLMTASLYLKSTKAKKIFFNSTPHDIESWLFFLAAHFQGARIFIASSSALPWRGIIKEIIPDIRFGYKTKNIILNSNLHDAFPSMSSRAESYIKIKKGDYASAEQNYMKIQRKKKKILFLPRLIHHFRRLTGKLLQTEDVQQNYADAIAEKIILKIRKKGLIRSLQRYTKEEIPPGNNVVTFFLHYQPERTSIPEGGLYSQQILAIQAISNALPEAWSLIVKEHPSIFLINDQKNFRHPDFYSLITKIPNTYFVGTLYSPFKLIDQSRAVVTLTGSVGFEALCRGTPVIALGDASYKYFPGVIPLGDNEFLPKNIKSLIEKADEQLKDTNMLLAKVELEEKESFWDESDTESLSRGTMALMALRVVDIV